MCNTQPRRLWVKGRGVRGVVAKREGLETLVPQVYETNGSWMLQSLVVFNNQTPPKSKAFDKVHEVMAIRGVGVESTAFTRERTRDPIVMTCHTSKEGTLKGIGSIHAIDIKVEQHEVAKTTQQDSQPCPEVTLYSTPPLGIMIYGGLLVFPTFAMKTIGKGNDPHKRAYRPSLDSHPHHPKKPCLESLKGLSLLTMLRGIFYFSKWSIWRNGRWPRTSLGSSM